MKRLVGVVGILMLIGSPVRTARAENRYAIVNVQEVLETVDEGKKAKAQLEKAMLDRKKELDDKQKEYKKMEENFDKQKLILSPSALADKQKEMDNKKSDLQKYFMSAQQDMQKKEMELTGDILKKIRAVVVKIGADAKYDLIWEKNEGGVIYNKDTLDITAKVIDQYNKAYKK